MRLETGRLIIRPWEDRDRPAWAAINADQEVRAFYYPAVLSPAEANSIIDDCIARLAEHGFGFMAVERKADRALVGGIGFSVPGKQVPGSHEMEIGWIFGRPFWGQGLGFEAAQACLAYAWATLKPAEIIGYTSAINARSRRLMEKLGMHTDPADDFEDITVPAGNALRPHVLYRIRQP